MGSNIGVSDTASMLYLCHLADNYGFDTKALGFVISLGMKCYEKGILSAAHSRSWTWTL